MHAIKNALTRGLKLACSKAAYFKKGRDQLVPSTEQHLFEKKQSSQALNVLIQSGLFSAKLH